MGRKKVTKDPQGSYLKLYRCLLSSKQWKALGGSAKLAYINILYCFNGFNAKEIICPRTRLINPMASDTWLRATQELEKKGFIIVVRRAGFKHYPNIYELSSGWKKL